jgi:hypothetical protein
MKHAVVSTLISVAFVSQAFAVLRPPFPVVPEAPFDGELIIIGDDLAPDSANTPAASSETTTAVSVWTERYRLCPDRSPAFDAAVAKVWQRWFYARHRSASDL